MLHASLGGRKTLFRLAIFVLIYRNYQITIIQIHKAAFNEDKINEKTTATMNNVKMGITTRMVLKLWKDIFWL